MIRRVKGMTNFSRAWARSMYSYWPLQIRLYPCGSDIFSCMIFLARST